MSDVQIESGAIDAPGCISEGWQLVKPDYGLFILMGLLFAVITIIVSYIPYIGSFLNILISAPLLCGIYIALLMRRRGEIVTFGTMFEGFRSFLPAVLATLIPSLPALILGVVIGLMVNTTAATTASGGRFPFGQGLSAFLVISAIVVYLIVLVLQILMFFALPLIADRNLGIADAVKLSLEGATKNFGGIFVLLLLEGLLAIAGVLALCIGILFVIPIIYAANIIAYKSVFPDNNDNSPYNEPPRPDAYDGNFGMHN